MKLYMIVPRGAKSSYTLMNLSSEVKLHRLRLSRKRSVYNLTEIVLGEADLSYDHLVIRMRYFRDRDVYILM